MASNGKLSLVLIALLAACAGDDPQRSATADTATRTVSAVRAGQSSGADLYQRCVSCHQANGEGLPGSFPPLAGSEYAAAANTSVPINIVIRGMQGP
ncbi:MAG: c-type cytochrome, partial [Gemmatimonadaceae bacterium]